MDVFIAQFFHKFPINHSFVGHILGPELTPEFFIQRKHYVPYQEETSLDISVIRVQIDRKSP